MDTIAIIFSVFKKKESFAQSWDVSMEWTRFYDMGKKRAKITISFRYKCYYSCIVTFTKDYQRQWEWKSMLTIVKFWPSSKETNFTFQT